MKNNKLHKNIIFLLLIISVLVVIFSLLNSNTSEMSYNKFIKNLEDKKVEEVQAYSKSAENFKVKLKGDDNTYVVSNPQTDEFKETLLKHNVKVTEVNDYSNYLFPAATIATCLITCTILLKFVRQTVGNDDVSNDSKNISNKTFKDVIGLEEEKRDLLNIINIIKNPKKSKKVGAKIPKGILFDGPPGNGKTLLAKALAGECNMSFYSVSASDFIEKYVGMGAARVRRLFESARNNSPAIIFIDEIDAIGCKRTGHSGDKEYTQCLNAILSEMDGFNDDGQVIVIAATNRSQDLDSALVRAGRFDMKFTINKPKFDDRVKMISYYLKDKMVHKEVDIDTLAKETVDFSSSEIENLTNIAAFKAIERGDDKIKTEDFDEALMEILNHGKIKKNKLDKEQLITTCYHEAGHAIMTLLKTDREISRISVLPSSSGVGGFTMSLPKNENKIPSLLEIKNYILVLYAGRAAEYVLNNYSKTIESEDNVSLGASNDIEKATELIKNYVSHSTSNNALIDYNSFETDEVDFIKECEKVSMELWHEALNIIRDNFILVKTLAIKLMNEKVICNYKISSINMLK